MFGVSSDILAAPSFGGGSSQLAGDSFDWLRLLVHATVVGLGFLLTFHVIYPAILKRTKVTPLTLYGRCLGWFLIAFVGIFYAFWFKKLVFGDQTSQMYRSAPSLISLVVSGVSYLLATSFFRTPRRENL